MARENNFIGGYMTTVSTKVFLENPIHYLNLSNSEEVVIKRGKKEYMLIPKMSEFENPSPSGDPYWADPRNVAYYESLLKRRAEGKMEFKTLNRDERRKLLGL